MDDTEQPAATHDITVLSDPHRLASDIKTVGRAVREGWDVDSGTKKIVKGRLLTVLQKETVTVMTKMGPAQLDGPADSNAVAAARVFVAMNGQDQADDHADLKAGDGRTESEIDEAIEVELENMRREINRETLQDYEI